MGEKYLGQLTAKSAPATGDILVLEDSEDTKKIDYDALANAILNKLTTKTYTVAGGTNTLIAAIDALNSKSYTSAPSSATSLLSYSRGLSVGTYVVESSYFTDAPQAGTLVYEIKVVVANRAEIKCIVTGNSDKFFYASTTPSTTSIVWYASIRRTEFDTLNSKLNYKSILDNRFDTHDTQPGSYWVARAANIPDSHQYGFLTHEVSSADTQERLLTFHPYNSPGVFYKATSNNAGSTWTSWYKYIGTQVS